IGKNGKLYVVDSNNIGLPLLIKSDKNNFKLDLFQTNYGNLGLIKSNPKIIVTNILEVKDGIKIVANFHSDKVKNLNAKILDHRNIIDCKVKYLRDNKFTITIPYKLYQWGESRFLPSGRYELEVYKDSTKVELIFNQASMSDLPLSLSSHAPIVGNLEYKFRKKSLSLVVYPTIKLERQGERIRHENINKHKSENLKIDENAVFFRTYFGESTTCNALAIHNELIKRGTNLKMYWSVKDSSIKVPQDGITVVESSYKLFELYSTSKVIIDNMHQPEFFQKKNGQIVIATFHGYPFKSAGMPFWIKQGFSKKQIDLFLYRQSQWDYLVSPSPYATPILKEVFPSNADRKSTR